MGQPPFAIRFGDRSANGPEMIWLRGGTFRRGSPQGTGHDGEQPVHEVTLSNCAVGRYPATVGELRHFVDATSCRTEAERGDGAYVWHEGNWIEKQDGSWRNLYMEQNDSHPVLCISWNDAKARCDWLSGQTGQAYGLLTEAQWERACRAGTEAAYCFGDGESERENYAWYSGNAGDGARRESRLLQGFPETVAPGNCPPSILGVSCAGEWVISPRLTANLS
ncbi:MAG: formylglycine-generating enzyme family protein [Chromatiaceae bacterium]|nr:formylglycine-generating enzyme family protein [Chromatiaceae bacterium]